MKQFNPYNERAVAKLKQDYALGEKEKVIDVVYRHSMQLVIIFITTIFTYIITLGAIYFLVLAYFENDKSQAYTVTSFAIFIITIFTSLILVIATYLFFQTKLIITSENLMLVVQKDLLHRKISRLALTDIEDVTAEQQGLLPTLFDYSKLVIETAGAQVYFSFNYCPRSSYVAKELIDAKEDIVEGKEVYTS